MAGRPKAVTLGDVDLDGRPDIVLATVRQPRAGQEKRGIVWLRFRDSPFQPDWDVFDVSGPEGVKFDLNLLLDVDWDGDLDVINSEEIGNGRTALGVVWYENPGSASNSRTPARSPPLGASFPPGHWSPNAATAVAEQEPMVRPSARAAIDQRR